MIRMSRWFLVSICRGFVGIECIGDCADDRLKPVTYLKAVGVPLGGLLQGVFFHDADDRLKPVT
jgi:hypothetical protein